MSADPTAEHIDAVTINAAIDTVARAIRPWAWGRRADRQRVGARLDADRVLTSTDPAVHAALAASLPAEVMLAALVDRGTLTWQHDTREWRPAAGLIPRGRNNGVRWAARRVVGEWESDYGEVAP